MLVKIGSAFIDPAEIAAIVPDPEDDDAPVCELSMLCIQLRNGGKFWLEAAMDEVETVLIGAGMIGEADEDIRPELTPEEKDVCQKLLVDGWTWLAKDRDGKLFAYREKPRYDGAYWSANDASTPTCTRVGISFHFITTEDEEPWEIEKLLQRSF